MGININDLNNSLQSISTSWLSSDENALDNIRELSEKELKISGGTFFQPVSQPVFQPVSQPVFQPVSQPVFQSRPFGSNIDINVSSSSSSSSNSRPIILTQPEPEPEPERPPTTVSY